MSSMHLIFKVEHNNPGTFYLWEDGTVYSGLHDNPKFDGLWESMQGRGRAHTFYHWGRDQIRQDPRRLLRYWSILYRNMEVLCYVDR